MAEPLMTTASICLPRSRLPTRFSRFTEHAALIVKLAAAPVDGAANEALVAALSESFGLPRRAVSITAGQRSRTKRIEFAGVTPATLAARLAALLHD